jgi:hypothetical protein
LSWKGKTLSGEATKTQLSFSLSLKYIFDHKRSIQANFVLACCSKSDILISFTAKVFIVQIMQTLSNVGEFVEELLYFPDAFNDLY